MDDEKHFPPGAEPEETATETPQPESVEDKELKPEPAEVNGEKAQPEEKPEPEKDKAEPEKEPPADQLPKKRSIYDDLKDKKKEAKDAKGEAQTQKERADAAEARAAELQALLDKKSDATTTEEKADVDDEIKAFGEDQGLDPAALDRLVTIVAKRVKPEASPDGLKPEEVAAWRASQAATKQAEEDNAIVATAPQVKKQLAISNDTELDTVMKEVVRLAHTPEFHDKEVEYIVWKKQAELAKLVSPKRQSFESGTGNHGEGSEEKVDYSSGKVTPEQVSRALTMPKASYEVRSAK